MPTGIFWRGGVRPTVTDGGIVFADGTGYNITPAGTSGQALISAGAGEPAFGALDVSGAAITGDLPLANLAQGSALSVLGVTGNATADNASIAAGTDHQVLRRSGTALAFGALNLAQAAAITGVLPTANGGTSVDIASAALPLGSGQITFPASQNASSDANTLDDYEEGTFTPVDSSGAGLTFAFAAGVYIKVGGFVQVSLQVTYPATASGANALIGGLPFTSNGNAAIAVGYHANAPATQLLLLINGGATTITPEVPVTGAAYTNANMSNAGFVASGVYRV